MEDHKVTELVRQAEDNFKNGNTQISEYVSFSMKEVLDTIDAYIKSRFISGDTDDLGRPKPFFNIVLAVRNIWFRATDLDRKDIRIKATKSSHYLMAFLANIHLQNWMKKSNFGAFLNEWGRTLATYGSAVSKFSEKDGDLIPEVISWNRLLVDAVDFENNPKIEKLYFTPAQLRMNPNYDQKMVEALIEDSKQPRRNWSGQQKDNKSDYICVYEVHGNLSQAVYSESRGLEVKEGDDKVFYQQMHTVSFTGRKGEYNDYTLYCGKEKQDPYILTHLIREEGRTLSIGPVEALFDAQWMANDNAILIKNQLELASKIIFQTADPNFVGKNMLTQVQNGSILEHSQGNPLTQLNNKPDIAAMQAWGEQWHTLSKEITGTPEAIRGETMPSGTPYSLGAYLGSQAGSTFELMTENKGLSIEEMARKFVLPYLKKKMDTTKEIAATLESHEIKQIDSAFVPKEAIRVVNEQIRQDIMAGKATQAPDIGAIESQIRAKLGESGNQRFIRPSEIKTTKWSDILKDFVWEAEVEVSGEETDKKAVLQTLSTVLQTIATNPNILQDPNARLIFNKVLEIAGGVSSIELNQVENAPQQSQQQMEQITGQPVAPSGGMVGAGNRLLTQQQ